jgi:type VI secretion system secreted protein VgrG
VADETLTQDNRQIKVIDIPKLKKDALLLRTFSGHEGLSRLFHFDLVMLSLDANLKFEDLIGSPATIALTVREGTERYFNGVFSSFAYVGTSHAELGGKPVTFVVYQATLVPAMWMLTRRSDCRIFQGKDVLEIIKLVFKPYTGILIESRIEGDLAKREYCVQYRETDFNFVSRLLEEEGICYFFKHEEKQHTVVFANHPSKFKPCQFDSEVSFSQHPDIGQITEWALSQEVRPGKYQLRDFDFEQPRLDLTADSDGTDARKFQLYDFPGEYTKKDEGARLAKIRMEEEDTPRIVVDGSSTVRGFESGSSFKLKDHFRSDFNKDYLLTAIYHTCNQNDNFRSLNAKQAVQAFTYKIRFQCIPRPLPFRPPRVTPEPVMRGTQTAIVVGPEKEEIYTDKYGRVKVRFHWDREMERDEKPIKDEERSCWIRVSHPWAGNNWGAIWIPRIGQEVIVDFLEGDPDQPIITGRVYNTDNMPPYKLPDNHTQSGFKSRSSTGGDSKTFNEIRFEDKKGSEDLLIHAERTMHNSVETSQFITVGADRHIKTGYTDKDGNEHGDVKELVHNNHNLHVKGDQRTGIDGKSSTYVQKDCFYWVRGSHRTTVALEEFTEAPTIIFEAGQTLSLKGPGGSIVIDATGVTILGNFVNINSGGAPAVSSIGGGYIGDKTEPPEDPK